MPKVKRSVDELRQEEKELERALWEAEKKVKELRKALDKIDIRIEQAKEEERKQAEECFFASFELDIHDRRVRNNGFFLFDETGNVVEVAYVGKGETFEYVDVFEREYVLPKRLNGHRISSFYRQSASFYQSSFQEKLKSLCWRFDKNGKIHPVK